MAMVQILVNVEVKIFFQRGLFTNKHSLFVGFDNPINKECLLL